MPVNRELTQLSMTRGELASDLEKMRDFAEELAQVSNGLPTRINADPSVVEKDLARFVLAIINLIRRLLEKQAIRRIEGGSLTEEQIERLGETFFKLDQKLNEIKLVFGLEGEDLNVNLGPLGDLV